jgi:hypothetical protein
VEQICWYSAGLRLENQVAVVTGGTRGTGEGIVRRFVEEGAKVVFSGRSSDKGNALEEELRPNVGNASGQPWAKLRSPPNAFNLWNSYPDMVAVMIGPISPLMVPVAIVMMMPIRAVPIVVLNHNGRSFRAFGSREYHCQ